MGRRSHAAAGVIGAALYVLFAILAVPPPVWAAELRASEAAATAGDVVEVRVSYHADGAVVVGTQNDVILPPGLQVRQRGDGRPDCAVNPAIAKAATAFGFLPPRDNGSTAVRAIVLAFDNVDPIPDGATLYACQIQVSADSSAGDKQVGLDRLRAADAAGNDVALRGRDGRVIVAVPETDFTLALEDASGRRGELVSVAARVLGYLARARLIHAWGVAQGLVVSAAAPGDSPCRLDPAIQGSADFAYEPVGCLALGRCTAVRVTMAVQAEVSTAAVLYRCGVRVEPTAAVGVSYALYCSGLTVESDGQFPLLGDCSDGNLSVLADPTATATPSPTPVTVATATPSASVAATSTPITPPVIATPTINPCGSCPRGVPCQIVNGSPLCLEHPSAGSGGCRIMAADDGDPACMAILLLPVVAVLLARRLA